MRNLFSNRKILYLVLGIILVSVFTLTIVYAALSTVLEISGSAEVSSADWDIRLENVKVKNGSVGGSVPVITSNTTAEFNTTLNNPGDFYSFTVDVVNKGSIDAMIDSVVKTPTLTSEQAKYINYTIEYENGIPISNRQLVNVNSYVRLEVKVEYRRDINVSDLPKSSTVLDLAFRVNYTQAEESETTSINNSGVSVIDVVSGDYNTVGSEVCIGEECFYVIDSDNDSVLMLAKYNLYVGYQCNLSMECVEYGSEATGKQSVEMIGYSGASNNNIPGSTKFAATRYWSPESYPSYVYDEYSSLYPYLNNYKIFLLSEGINKVDVRLISDSELIKLGCNSNLRDCSNAPDFVTSTSYWTGVAYSSSMMHSVVYNGSMTASSAISNRTGYGARPVIEIPKSEF